ncbi:nudix hydrolase 10-like isoform X3 [Prunus dulcis]|nr:nudix hydrolase 10-like isoform X3 [Prunus dulcis]
MLVYWIPETTNTLPANASHRVGVGAIVVNDKKEMLVVQEKCGRFQGKGVWKIPTGVVDEGEDIFKAAVREVKEETGIDADFLEVLAFRQSHNTFFEKSDLFFVCMLHPRTFDIEKQELEIEAAKWMPLEEYAAQPVTQAHALFKYILELGSLKLDRDYAGFSPLHITSVFDDELSFLYLNRQQMQCLSSPDQSS